MKKTTANGRWLTVAACLLVTMFCTAVQLQAAEIIKIVINGQEIESDVAPVIMNNRTMVPIRVISESLGMEVEWDEVNRQVIISDRSFAPSTDLNTNPIDTEPTVPVVSISIEQPNNPDRGGFYRDAQITIMGSSVATSRQLKALLRASNPDAPDLVDLYLEVGAEYGIRGDLAFCQAAKETGWWKYGNLVQPYQNNYCGLGATGAAATGSENLNGADPLRVSYQEGVHGAIFATPRDGVEAQIQHLYAYCSKDPLPLGKSIVDPRFTLVTRGIATYWTDLNGRWAVPGTTYGQSIIQDYFEKALQY